MNRVVLILSVALLLCVQAFSVKVVTIRKDRLLTEQMTTENTVYKFTADVDLGGATVTVPSWSTLHLKNGVLSNGVIVGRNTKIITAKKKRFGNQLRVLGAWDVDNVYSEWFGAKGDGTDETDALIAFFNFPASKKTLKPGIYGVNELHCGGFNNTELYAYGATLKYLLTEPDISTHNLEVLTNYDGDIVPSGIKRGKLRIFGLTIDGNSQNFIYESNPTVATSIVTHHTLRLVLLDNLLLKDCTFINSFMTAVLLDACNQTEVVNCKIVNSGESQSYSPIGSLYTWEGICMFDNVHTTEGWIEKPCEFCVVRDSYFENIGGSFASANCRIFRCFNNTIVDNRGYGFELGCSYDNRVVEIYDNTFTRVGSSVINMTGFQIPDNTVNTIRIYNNKFYDLCYDSQRTKNAPKNFLMIYRNKQDNGILDVVIKENLFDISPLSSQGLICSDSFLFEGNTCRGFSGGKDKALFYCGNDKRIGHYIIKNNVFDFHSGAVSMVRNPKLVEIADNVITTSLAPAILYVQGDENISNTVYSVHDNEVNGVSSMTYVSSTPKLLEIYNNKSETICDAIYRPTSDVPVECRIRNNSFKTVSKSTRNIRIIENQ